MTDQADEAVIEGMWNNLHRQSDIVTSAAINSGGRSQHNFQEVACGGGLWRRATDRGFPQLVYLQEPVTSHQTEQDVFVRDDTEELFEVGSDEDEMGKSLRDDYLGDNFGESQVAHGDLPVPVCGEAIHLSAENEALRTENRELKHTVLSIQKAMQAHSIAVVQSVQDHAEFELQILKREVRKLTCQLEQLEKEKTVKQAEWKKEQEYYEYEISLGQDKEDELKKEIQDLRVQLKQNDRPTRVNEFFAPTFSDEKVCYVPDSGLSTSGYVDKTNTEHVDKTNTEHVDNINTERVDNINKES